MPPEPSPDPQTQPARQNGAAPNSAAHETAVKKKADAFLKKIYDKDDVAAPNEKGGYALDAETLNYLIKHHEIIELKKGELVPSADIEFSANATKPDGHYRDPIYVVPGAAQDKNGPQVLIVKTSKNDKSIYLVPEGDHKYDENYYRNNIQWRDADYDNAGVTADKFTLASPEAQQRYEALLAHINAKAGEDHINAFKLLIQDGDRNYDVGSNESYERKNYLLLSQNALEKALSSDAGTEALTKSIDSEMASMVRGDNTPSSIVKTRNSQNEAVDFLNLGYATLQGGHVVQLLPNDTQVISNDTLAYMAQSGGIEEVKRGDIKNSGSDPVFQKKDAQGKDLPVYVIPGVADDANDKPRAHLMTTKEGQQYILINEGYHKWDAEYVRNHEMGPSKEFADLVKKGDAFTSDGFLEKLHKEMGDTPEYAAMAARYQKLMDSMAKQEGRTGQDAPTILIDSSRDHQLSQHEAAASLTSDNKQYVTFNEQYLREALATDAGLERAKTTAGHELAHLQNGDQTAEMLARAHNDFAFRKEEELRADLTGAGPQGAHNTDATVRDEILLLRSEIRQYNQDTHANLSPDKLTPENLKAVAQWHGQGDAEHPDPLTRIAAMQEEARLMKQYEGTFEAQNHHKPMSKEELAAESKAVIDQVMQEYRDSKLPPADLNAAAQAQDGKVAANAPHGEQVEAVKASLGSRYQQVASTDVSTPPVAPYVPNARPTQDKGAAKSA